MDFGGFFVVATGFFGGFLGGFLAGLIGGGIGVCFQGWRIDSLEARFQRLHNQLISGEGVQAHQASTARNAEALAFVGQLIGEGKAPGDAIAEGAKKYPDVALKLGAKVAKQQGLGGIFKGLGL